MNTTSPQVSLETISSEKQRVALSSVAAGIFLTGFKLGIGLWTGSLGIISEAAHSGLDFAAALITYFALRVSDKPADRDHMYGHGKVENFSALIETVLLLFTCGWIFYEAVRRLFFARVEIEINFWSFFVIITAIVVDFSRSRALGRIAEKYNSQALEADALHFRTDIWSSSVVLLGLLFSLLHIQMADAIAAMIVAGIIVFVSLRLGKRTIDALMDRAPEGIVETIRKEVVNIKGIAGVENIRVRQSGTRMFVDMVVNVPRSLPFQAADELVDGVEDRIHAVVPNSDVIVHMEPVPSEEETLVDRVRVVARNAALSIPRRTKHIDSMIHARVHHVHVYRLSDSMQGEPGGEGKARYHATLHVECDSNIDFPEAHALSGAIEEKVKAELPEIASIAIRIDERSNAVMDAVDLTASKADTVEMMRARALSEPGVLGCEDIRLLDSHGKIRVSMICYFDGRLPLREVDKTLTAIERSIYSSLENVVDVTIRAVPQGA